MKHIVCYSGGHSSALVAIEVVRKFGKNDVILCNHECKLEPLDVQRFEEEVAKYLDLPITHVNFEGSAERDQFDVVVAKKSFVDVRSRNALCTHVMKTEPFMKWLNINYSDKDCILYYGFDGVEKNRITRRSTIMSAHGYKTDYPLALWKDRTIFNTNEINILPPNSYDVFKHANCMGCLKAGWQHWYCVYVLYPEIYEKGVFAENEIGHSIHRDHYLDEMRDKFDSMIKIGIMPTEKIDGRTFWASVKKQLKDFQLDTESDIKPCECIF